MTESRNAKSPVSPGDREGPSSLREAYEKYFTPFVAAADESVSLAQPHVGRYVPSRTSDRTLPIKNLDPNA